MATRCAHIKADTKPCGGYAGSGKGGTLMDDEQPLGSTEQAITRQCTAKSKRSGRQCRKPAMKGRTVCLAHGGRTPRGVASPNFKTGRYSRSLPGHLVADYKGATHDPTLLSLRDDIALNEAMIATLLQQLDESPDNPAKDRRIFRQVMRQTDLKRRLVATEVRHMVLACEMMPAEQVMALFQATIDIVSRYVPDPKDRQALAEEMQALLRESGGTHDAR